MMIRVFVASVTLAVCTMLTHRAWAATDFVLRKGLDDKSSKVVGTHRFDLRAGGVRASFKTPQAFSMQALRLTGPQRGLGIKSFSNDERPHFISRGESRDELVRIKFNKGISLSSIRLAMLKDTNPNKISLILRGGGQTQRIAVTDKRVDLSGVDVIRQIALRYTGANGGIRLNALRGVAAITSGTGGDDDGDGDDDDGGGPPVVIPLPASVWTGLVMLASMGATYALRKRAARQA